MNWYTWGELEIYISTCMCVIMYIHVHVYVCHIADPPQFLAGQRGSAKFRSSCQTAKHCSPRTTQRLSLWLVGREEGQGQGRVGPVSVCQSLRGKLSQWNVISGTQTKHKERPRGAFPSFLVVLYWRWRWRLVALTTSPLPPSHWSSAPSPPPPGTTYRASPRTPDSGWSALA